MRKEKFSLQPIKCVWKQLLSPVNLEVEVPLLWQQLQLLAVLF